MPIIAFDEAHGASWSIDANIAQQSTPRQPEYHFFGHLAELLGSDVNFRCIRFTDKFSVESLRGIDVLILVDPILSGLDDDLGLGSAIYSREELQALEQYVRNGGGIAIFGEHSPEIRTPNLKKLTEIFGFRQSNGIVLTPESPENAHILSRHFQIDHIVRSPITRGVSSFSYHKGSAFQIFDHDIAKAIAFAPDEHASVVLVLAQLGHGAVIGIGDTDLFSIPYIGMNDNIQLFKNIIVFLSSGESDMFQPGFLTEKSYFKSIYYNRNLREVITPIDCSQCYSELHVELDPFDISKSNTFLDEAELRFQQLPRNIRKEVNDFKRNGNKYGCLLLTGLEPDPALPSTPADSRRQKNKTTYWSESYLSALSRGLGEIFSYQQEKDGVLYHNICPVQKNETELSSESSAILLDFHTETAFHPLMPDFVLLYCLRSDHDGEAKTEVASTREIIKNIPIGLRGILFQSCFRTGIDFSFGSESGTQGNGPLLPIFTGNPYDPFMRFDPDLMEGTSQQAQKALDQMKLAMNTSKNFIRMQPGDLAIIDNRRAVHSRSIFIPKYDGKDRWLQRVYVVRDICSSDEYIRTRQRIVCVEFRP